MNKFLFQIILIITSLLSFKSNLVAQSSKVDNIFVSADLVTRDFKNKKIDLIGSIQVAFQGQYLYSQKATIDLKTKSIIATGKVTLATPSMTLEGDYMEMNYQTNIGFVNNGYIESGHTSFAGKTIKKVGDKQFEVIDGSFTACKTCPPAWSFSGKKIKATLGGYAHIYQPILSLAELPVLWFPYLIVPLKSSRETGLLFPSYESSAADGSTFSGSWFWAIDDHRDATFTLKNYSKRGLKTLINHRFYMDQKSYGELDFAFLNDKVFPQSSRLTGFSDEPSLLRWFLKYKHIYDLPDDFYQRINLNLISDLQYLTDFPSEITGIGDPALESRVSLTKNSENWHSSIEVAYYQNLLKSDAKEDNDDAVHRFPEIKFSLIEREVGASNLFFEFNSSYTNFARNNFSFDDITFDSTSDTPKVFNPLRDGEFNFDGTTSQDQIRSGQRLDFEPKFTYPINFDGIIDILPTVSYRNTTYSFDVGDDAFANRSFLRTELSIKTNLSRIYSSTSDKKNKLSHSSPPIITKYKHEIIPKITFTNVPIFNQPNHPFFGTSSEVSNFRSDQPVSDQDFFSDTGLQFDYFDRILDRRLLTMSFTNNLTRKQGSIDNSNYTRIARVTVLQSYDYIEAQKKTNARPWSDMRALADIRLNNFDTNTVINYFPYQNVTNISSRARITNDSGNFAQLLYSKRLIIDDTLDVDPSTRSENLGFSLGFNSMYFNISGILDYSLVTSQINSWYYQINVKPPGECWGFIYRQQQVIGGEAKVTFNFSFSFDGKNPVNLNDTLY